MSSLDTEANALTTAATTAADDMAQRARAIRAAANTIAGIMKRAASGIEPSESRDGKRWEDAAKVLDAAGVKVPNSAHLLWKA